MHLKMTHEKNLIKRGEALFIAVVDIPYVHVFENLSKESKWKQYMYSLEEAFPLPFRKWQNPAKTYTEMAKEIGFEVVSCEQIIKDHQYNALTWKAVNPFLPRIKGGLISEVIFDLALTSKFPTKSLFLNF